MNFTKSLPELATGKWPNILQGLGVPSEFLSNRHGPCPGCGGTDRFRYDDKDGRGTWVCGQGGDPIFGDGFQLLEHVFGWDRRESFARVAEYLGVERFDKPARPAPTPIAAPQKPVEPNRLQEYARELWARADRSDAAVADHPYAKARGISWAAGAGRVTAAGLRIGQGADCIIVPVYAFEGDELVAVQCINPEGVKQTFGPSSQGVLALGNKDNWSLERHVVEGWATGVHVWRKEGNIVVYVAFGKGRQRAVAEWVEQQRPGGQVWIATERGVSHAA